MNNHFNFENYTYPDMEPINNYAFPEEMKAQQMNSQQTNGMTTMKLTGPYDGFTRGNLFDNLYDQYQNYRPMKLIPNTEQAEMLLNVDQLTFATHELNLYLDVYPNDEKMLALFNKYRAMANEAIHRYEQSYGPLTVSRENEGNTFQWENTTWPWEMGVM